MPPAKLHSISQTSGVVQRGGDVEVAVVIKDRLSAELTILAGSHAEPTKVTNSSAELEVLAASSVTPLL